MFISKTKPDEHIRFINVIARESAVSIDEVARLYDHERAALEASSRIKAFVPVFVMRKVRDLLRRHASNQPIPSWADEILGPA
ncbi:MAG TPA: DUF3562 domain-containing protein [Pseudomonadales bacterium]|nr:DUF3562 domain-containing protein [Pseudomonadales bacterium]